MYLVPVVVSVILIVIDRVTKLLAVNYLFPVGNIPLIPGFFELTFVRNEGAAFGMLQGFRWIFVAVTVLICAGIVYFYSRLPATKSGKIAKAALVLVVSGAIGNLIDRAWVGNVVDFFHFSLINFPVFNMADSFVVCGAILFAIVTLFAKEEKPEPKGGEPAQDGTV